MNKHIKLIHYSPWLRRAPLSLLCGASLFAAPFATAQDDEEDSVFELSPFTVDGSDDQGYRATSTLAGTRIRTGLKDVGSAISVVTEEFLRDTNATDNESLLVYTTNMEVAGTQGNFAGGGDGPRVDTDSQRRQPNASTRVRGLAAADNTRNFFSTDIPWDSYNVKRIDLQRGPNSILFGLGSPAGVINANVDQATFKDGGDFEIRIDDHGTTRFSANYNKVLIEDELSVRVAALAEDQKFQQDGAFEQDDRLFVAFKYQPSFLKGDSSSGTLTGSIENGKIDANRPRTLPPIDRITPWFTEMDKATYDSTTVDQGVTQKGEPEYDPWVGSAVGRIFDGPVAVFDDSGSASYYFMGQISGADGGRYRGVDTIANVAKNYVTPLTGAGIGAWKSATLTDPSIFNFYDTLLEGPNKSEWQEWDAYNITYAHNWLDNRLGLEIAFDKQDYQDGQTNILNNWGQSISVDIMTVFPDGSPNPNVGRPFIGGDAQNNNTRWHDRETLRATAYYEHDFRDQNDSVAWMGRHVFTALYSDFEMTKRSVNWIRNTAINVNPGSDITQANRYVATLSYLGPSLAGASSAAGANLSGLNHVLVPTGGSLDLGDETISLGVYSADAGGMDSVYNQANFADDSVESQAIVWQGFLFDGLVVPMFGYREDDATARNAGNVPNHPTVNGAKLPFDPDWTLPADANDLANGNSSFDMASGTTKTYSLVLNVPDNLMPEGMDLGFYYGESSNFNPDASRKDLRGDPIAPSSGETEEFGLTFGALNGKLNLRINKYETKVFRDTLSSSSIPNSYMIGAGEGWGYMFGTWADAGAHDFWRNFALEDPEKGLGEELTEIIDDMEVGTGVFNTYINPEITDLRYAPQFAEGMSDAERAAVVAATKAQQDAALDALFDPANRPDPDILAFWNQDLTFDASGGWDNGGDAWAGEPATFAVTGDTVSEGYEYELFYQPTQNWNIAVNASKTSAKRLNIAESYASYVNERWALYQGAYGDVRLWGPFVGETIGNKYGGEFYSNYLLFTLLNNSDVPELRPWRFNLVSNYNVTEGPLSGFNFGGSIRWQDEITVGFPVTQDSDGNDIYDSSNPFKGATETNFDFWAGYQKELNDNIDWRVQLNIRNAFTGDELIPITVQPDGTAATSRIAPGRSFTLTNTFSF